MRGRVGLVWALATLALCVPVARAFADVYDDNPATASRGTNDLFVYARRSSDGAILERHWLGDAWSDWTSIGGVTTSGPAAAAYGSAINVFARGTDGAIYQNSLVNGLYTGWSSLGGYSTSAPAASARVGTPYFDVAMRGGDNAIWIDSFAPGSGYLGWKSLGGNFTSAPSLDSQANGIVNVFARDAAGNVEQDAWTGSQWTGWTNLGGSIVGAPEAVTRTPNTVDVFVRGADDNLYVKSWNGSAWSDWTEFDTMPQPSAPVPLTDQPGREILFARNGDEMFYKLWTGAWTPWTDFGPIAVPTPPAAPPPAAAAPLPDGSATLSTGLRCTPPAGKLRVSIAVHKPKHGAKPRVAKIVFFTRGPGHRTVEDHKAPFQVHIRINKAAGGAGRVYARIYYRTHTHGPLHKKTVSRRYTVCL